METERLLFRDHEPGDLEAYCAMESDPVYRAPQPVHPRAELERSFRDVWLVPKPLALRATVFKPDNRYIGRCGLYPFRNESNAIVAGEAVLAFYLAREYWGRGLATEAGEAFVRHGFETLGLRRIHAGMNAENKASIRVIEKLGFTRVRSGEGGGNRWHDYELLNNLALILMAVVLSVACGGSKPPNGPTPQPRLSHTRFMAFGDSFTAGEVTNPASIAPSSPIGKLVLVPAASYPNVLETRLRVTYSAQAILISVANAGVASERILDGAQRFPSVYDGARPEVVLIQEGANGLPQVGPDISTGVMRTMVQHAKAGGSRVFVGSMIPQVPGRPRATTPTSELLAYNNTLQLMSQQEGVVYVDLYNAMLTDAGTLIGSDGLHPTEAGYSRIAEIFFNSIRANLETR